TITLSFWRNRRNCPTKSMWTAPRPPKGAPKSGSEKQNRRKSISAAPNWPCKEPSTVSASHPADDRGIPGERFTQFCKTGNQAISVRPMLRFASKGPAALPIRQRQPVSFAFCFPGERIGVKKAGQRKTGKHMKFPVSGILLGVHNFID